MNAKTTRKAREAERVYHFICAYLEDYGIAPRRREIAEAIGFSAYQVDHALVRLRAAGRIAERGAMPTTNRLPPVA